MDKTGYGLQETSFEAPKSDTEQTVDIESNETQINIYDRFERFSIAASIQESIRDEEDYPLPEEMMISQREIPEENVRKKLQEFIGFVMQSLKKNTEVQRLRIKVEEEGYEALDKYDRQALFDAFQKARKDALEKVEMTPVLKRKLKFYSQLNYSLKACIIEGKNPEAWMILNPKLRKVDAMTTQEIIRYLKNLMVVRTNFEKTKGKEGEASELEKQLESELNLLKSEEGLGEKANRKVINAYKAIRNPRNSKELQALNALSEEIETRIRQKAEHGV